LYLKNYSKNNIKIFSKNFRNIKLYEMMLDNIKIIELNDLLLEKYKKDPNHNEIDNKFSIVHCVNYYFSGDEDSDNRQVLAIDSTKKQINNIKFINYSDIKIDGKFINYSDSKVKEKPKVKYLLDICEKYSENFNDLLIVTNSDCVLMDNFYDLQHLKDKITFLYRTNINNNKVADFYTEKNSIHVGGIDGIIIPKNIYLKVRKELLDVSLGEAKWDNYFYHYFTTKYPEKCEEIVNLFHIDHKRTWDIDQTQTHNSKILQKINNSIPINYFKKSNPIITIIIDVSLYKKSTIELFLNNIKLQYMNIRLSKLVEPIWLGNELFHASHRSNLLRKNTNLSL
jgi:hypothetical protein